MAGGVEGMIGASVALFDRILRGAAMAFVVLLLGTVTAGILWRAAGHPLSWTDEAAGYVMVWLASFGWMIATRNHAHIRIRFFQDLMRAPLRSGTERVIQAGVALLGAVVAWKAVHLVVVNHDIEATSMPISSAWLYVPLVPAGVITAFQALADFWRGPQPLPAASERAE